MYTLMIISAALSYSVGGYYMKLAEGFNKVTPSVLVFTFFFLGAAFQTVAMRGSQIIVTCIIVLGVKALTDFALSIFFSAKFLH